MASVDPKDPSTQAGTSTGGPGRPAPDAGQGSPLGADEAEPVEGLEGFYGDDEEFAEDEGEETETVDELGRRHVRRAAPEGTDQMLENEAPRVTGLPDGIERWRRNSATGAVLTAFAFGLQQAFEPERKEPAIVMQTSGDPPKDLPVEAQLEQLGPRQSSVKVRTWLLGGEGQAAASAGEPAEDEAGSQ